jgi:hypothetical protein
MTKGYVHRLGLFTGLVKAASAYHGGGGIETF